MMQPDTLAPLPQAGRLQEALVCYSNALEAGPTTAVAATIHLNRALLHLKLGRPEDCIIDCTTSLELAPDDDFQLTIYRRAEARVALGQLQEAMRDLTLVLGKDPHNPPCSALACKVQAMMQNGVSSEA